MSVDTRYCIFCLTLADMAKALGTEDCSASRVGHHAYTFNDLSKRERLIAAGYDEPTCDLIDAVVTYGGIAFKQGVDYARKTGPLLAPAASAPDDPSADGEIQF